MKKAKQFQKYKDDMVRCSLCNHRCIIKNGKTGICGARYNKAGVLYTLYYGKPIAVHVDPIEKKPLYHFLKGTYTYSFGTLGCNFRCDWCQNWEISQGNKTLDPQKEFIAKEYTPKQLVENAIKSDCPSLSYTYTEPTIFFEYALDTMKIARGHGLKNIWVSNGYFTAEAFKEFGPYLDAINVDLKGFENDVYQKYCGARLEPVLENLKRIKKAGHIHLEITTLLVPGVNDDEQQLKKLTEFIAQELGSEIPLHLSRFFPCYKMVSTPPTPRSNLERAKKIGEKAGLKYVYLGNI